MSDIALQKAEATKKQLVKRRLDLHAELKNIDRRVGEIDRFIETWHEFADSPVDPASVEWAIQNEYKEEQTTKRTTGNSPKEEVVAVAIELIRERGQPIMRDELYELLIEAGLTIQGKDPQMVLSTMLWRMKDKIVRVEGGGYWPADTPNVVAGYDPNTATLLDTAMNTPINEIPNPNTDGFVE